MRGCVKNPQCGRGCLVRVVLKGDVVMGEQIAKDLIEQDPYSFSHYNLLVNVYTAAGKWEDVARVKEMMREGGIQKAPCCSLKELKEIVEQH
ncbi:pentatricopeptide repeat-containing protein-like protein [Salvia divinorum]|uniref:Pentatricopeptide repeat-containing protein-like protein n=1 Tax=Salvia divinorum TaxID=28513 RepID=A0ABD1GF66_SALDI